MSEQIPTYNGLSPTSLDAMLKTIQASLATASASIQSAEDDEGQGSVALTNHVSDFANLLGVDPEVYRQINSALASGSRNLMFYGPPGTGKTTIAQQVAGAISDNYTMITGSADWSSQEIIGGYHPLSSGEITFLPGVMLRNFDKPLIFDELNRCDIDKVIGPLFTVLSGQATTLPYLTDASDPESPRIEITPHGVADPPRVYAPSADWRLIATINSMDKASLYQMSYALTRRFAWIFVDVPRNSHGFICEFVQRYPSSPQSPLDGFSPLGKIWESINEVRPIGAAPIIDIIRTVLTGNPAFNLFVKPSPENTVAIDSYLDGFLFFCSRCSMGFCEKLAKSWRRMLFLLWG
ncbi:AAA family ATPase [Rhodopirellula sallentina]|uniref:ATPase AAA n=1 Tax=Rhodopirellula sallentina SM41 TaxID=1263870 RepID=M5UBK7_9BACT|nr:AAA family ATPase [Rhodopirellula sallentina]EMI55221.1 ATPase AAA [Rhodopirellula sallentina SM41]